MLQSPHVLLTFKKVHNPLRLPRETTSQRPKVARTCGVLYILTSKCASRHNGVHFFDISSKTVPRIVFLVHFDFEMCFAPQRRTLFRHLNFQKCSEREVFFSFFICKRASRHNGMHFFDISTSKSGPELVCFVHFDFEMCFALLFSSLWLFPSLLFTCPYCRKFDFKLPSIIFLPTLIAIQGLSECSSGDVMGYTTVINFSLFWCADQILGTQATDLSSDFWLVGGLEHNFIAPFSWE